MSDENRHFEDYLGDGAYVYLDDFRGVVLYTSNGVEETNRVVLEPEVLVAFERWVRRMRLALNQPEADAGWALREARELIDKGFKRVDLHGRLACGLDAARAQGQRDAIDVICGGPEPESTTLDEAVERLAGRVRRAALEWAAKLMMDEDAARWPTTPSYMTRLAARIRRGPEAPDAG